jgi:uncharacterized membrane protein YkoI
MALVRKHVMQQLSAAVFATGLLVAPLAAQKSSQEPTYKRDLPAKLVKEAKVSEADAAKTALARVPKGHIEAVELENEGGKLLYSYELKVPGRSGIEEVNVDAKTGTVANTEHESPATERKEAKAEKKKAKPTR